MEIFSHFVLLLQTFQIILYVLKHPLSQLTYSYLQNYVYIVNIDLHSSRIADNCLKITLVRVRLEICLTIVLSDSDSNAWKHPM